LSELATVAPSHAWDIARKVWSGSGELWLGARLRMQRIVHTCQIAMTRLAQVRHQLLALHRSLLDAERIAYERLHGRQSAGAFLQQVIDSPELAWLRPLTALIVAFDEVVDETWSDTTDAAAEAAYLEDARKLLAPNADGSEFERRYAEVMQCASEVVLAHGAVMRALG
jgi:hypothetical protein